MSRIVVEPAPSAPTLAEQESDFTAEGAPAPGMVSASVSAASVSHGNLDKRGEAARMSDTMAADTLPTSFGVFKPVGHVMIGLPTQAQADALVTALHGAGWASASVLHFSPSEGVPELKTMVHSAGAAAGFGYEITLLRRYLALAQEGYRWLLVKVDDGEHAAAASQFARACGATVAVYYRTLTVEDLIP
jgi:hypothetical protein